MKFKKFSDLYDQLCKNFYKIIDDNTKYIYFYKNLKILQQNPKHLRDALKIMCFRSLKIYQEFLCYYINDTLSKL
jgi:hypothetical protein